MKQVCLIKKRISFFMRVLFCKIHCPFTCFCKPSSHICTPRPLELESSPHEASTTTTVVSLSDDHHVYAERVGVKEESVVVDGNKQQQEGEGEGEGEGEEAAGENCVKSSLKKEALDSKEVEKKKVQWMDYLGKELVEIREFEASCLLEKSRWCGKGFFVSISLWLSLALLFDRDFSLCKRSFDRSEMEDTDNESEFSKGCVCTIL
ncbi:nuclear polyadenylated RNA-binding protein [Citrus sinensis]|uniref:Nuclear polyadenylated RNA-binding protein n=1 Tax=Citrus sinensis TaxID=2711 RepID=A0ACB8MTA7_CITSI|nr:uncharacterized protein LOC18050437 isoform X2 [Citrus x clementina]XP_024947962.1 uncharacterized protein LOC102623684 isoform X1 [Citrus sinensis]KAH9740526.1 nuclear polyadenylated RNA-binding protein [Citrus sinensis]KAH9789044.1 nuclear polyadenylated RNA-binding protein [Citrus sinensis]